LLSLSLLFLLTLGFPFLSLAESHPEAADPEAESEESPYETYEIEPLDVVERKPMTAASDQVVRDKDFLNLPRQNPSDLLRIVPGIFISQHTGGGKAHQIFLRGFEAEHGQDLAGYLSGIPLNEASQVHGQGYLDLHFLIPETLNRIRIVKGPYLPEYGNFAVAGAIDFLSREWRPKNKISLTYGSFNSYSGLAEISGDFNGKLLYLAAEGNGTDGFTNPGDLWGARGFMSLTLPTGTHADTRIVASAYQSEFDAADVVPTDYDYTQRPTVGRFDSVDPSGGGESSRYLMGLSYDWKKATRNFSVLGYYNYRKTVLYTNYTYFLFNPDPDRGDQYELYETRHYGGLRTFYEFSVSPGSMLLTSKFGLDTRIDSVRQSQSNSHLRRVYNTITDYEFMETNLGMYIKETLTVNKYLRFMAGIRIDGILYDITGTQDMDFRNLCTNREDTLQDVPVSTATYQWAYSPKFSTVITPFERPAGSLNALDIFLNYGEGFSSLRAPLIANLDPPDIAGYPEAPCVEWPTPYPGNDHEIPKARSAEVVGRLYFWDRKAYLMAGFWWAGKEQELVFEPESAISQPRGKSQRVGQEVELRIEPLDWLYLAFDFYHTNAEFVDEQVGMSSDDIPGTPEILFNQVLSVRHPSGFRGALRGRYVGKRPLPQEKPLPTLYADAYYVVDLLLAYGLSWWAVEIEIQNLFDTEWDDTAFAYPSSPEGNPDRVPGTPTYQGEHITPGTPFAIAGRVTFRF
jgi:hypothetical protein